MTINLDLIVETDEDSIDMKSGLDTMQGVSNAVRYIAETVITESTPKKHTHKSNVRTNLKRNFKGSFGQIFSIEIYDEELRKKMRKIGKSTLVELISYFINESLYKETEPLTEKSQTVLERLGEEKTEDLVKQLRVSSLENIHEISVKFNYDVKIRYRENRDTQKVLAFFNKDTAKTLLAKESTDKYDIKAIVTRLNIHTGNGRLQIEGADETVAFGFAIEYKEVTLKAKKIFSENLDFNNGIKISEWKYLRISVSPIVLRDGKIIKYIVKGFYEN